MWHVGVLYRALDLLEAVATDSPSERSLHDAFRLFRGVSLSAVLDVCREAGWLSSGIDGRTSVTSSGSSLLAITDTELRLREQIAHLLHARRPPWARAILQGRSAVTQYAPSDALQCLQEAGLIESIEPDVISWWDKQASLYRDEENAKNVATGRVGERLSVMFEETRTGIRPRWISLEFEGSGYDILSRMSRLDPGPLAVEVKTSVRRWEEAEFHLTRNEWDYLSGHPNSTVHLWSVYTKPVLFAVLSIEALSNHIVADMGDGKWSLMTCPFRIVEPAAQES